MSDQMRSEFETWIAAEAERDSRIVRIVRERDWYAGRDKHYVNTSWLAWQASRAAVVIRLPADSFLSRDGLDEHYLAGDIRDQFLESIKASGVRTSK